MSSTNAVLSDSITSAKTAEERETSTGSLSFYFRLILLYLLNIVDWLCTETLIASGKFYEANPVMQSVLGNFWLTLFIKGALPLLLLLICALIYRFMQSDIGITANVVLHIGITAYALINIWHIANFVLLFLVF